MGYKVKGGLTFSLLAIILLLAALPAGCGGTSPQPVDTPAPTPAATDEAAPEATSPPAEPAEAATSEIVPTLPVEPEITPSPEATPEPEPVAAEVTVKDNRAVVDFPESMTFVLDAGITRPASEIVLEYGTNKRSLAKEVNRIKPEFGTGQSLNVQWTWNMRKSGSIPMGTEVWWRWRITDEAGGTFTTEKETITFKDDLYDWKVTETEGMNLYSHGISAGLLDELVDGVEDKLERIELAVAIPPERKPKIFVYPDRNQLLDAMLFPQQWTGAVAYSSYNIILIPVNAGNIDWAKRTIAHESTHLIVRDAVFGPFGDIPTWLSEGLAQYAEGEMEDYQHELIEEAITEGKLFSVDSLSGSFPTDSEQASLAYAQSASLIVYLLDEYGWDKMEELLMVYKDGSSDDKALLKVYSFDVDGLDETWRSYIGAGSQ